MLRHRNRTMTHTTRRSMSVTMLAALFATPMALAQDTTPSSSPAATTPAAKTEPIRATSHWNLGSKDRLAIAGYDPVAYFPEGGGKPKEGSASITLDHNGAVYRFASAESKAKFEENPAKYEPAYGGWCAWAMLDGEKVEVDPDSFIVKDGRLFLFYDGFFADTRAKWSKNNHVQQAAKADVKWRSISGEMARHGGMPRTMAQAMKAKGDELAKGMPKEALATFDEGIRAIEATGVTKTALKVGDMAPDFELADAKGKTASLKAMLKDGPVVLTWYRGGWCPFCDVQLRGYQEMLPEMQEAGGRLVALSPEGSTYAAATSKKASLAFDAMTDQDNAVAKKFGIAYKVPEPVAGMLEQGVQLSKVNGTASGELPLAATYVIDTSGRIAYAYVSADYRTRAEPTEIVAALRGLNAVKRDTP
jgi:peroxiredoxin/YHS domain-containing protein